MSRHTELLDSDAWYAWQEEDAEQSWLLSYVDVLSVILAMLLVLLVSRLQTEEVVTNTAPAAPAVPFTPAVAPPAPIPLTLHSPLSAALPPPVSPVVSSTSTPSFPATAASRQSISAEVISEPVSTDGVAVTADVAQDAMAVAADGVTVVRHEGGVTLEIADVVLFDSSKAQLRNTAAPVLERAIGLLRGFGDVKVAVQGHTDDRPVQGGIYRSNWELAAARANAVAAFLLQQGFSPELLRVESYADTRPVAENITASGRAQNRRVELQVEFEQELWGQSKVPE